MNSNFQDDKILYEIIDAISSLGIEEVLTKVDNLISKITNADSTGIYTLDERTESVVLRASKLHFSIVGRLKMNLGEGITGWVAKYGKTVVIEKDAEKDPRFHRVRDLPDDLYSAFLSVPIKSGNVIVGVVNVKHKNPHVYGKETVKLLETIGKLIGRAIEHAELLEKSRSLEEAVVTQKAVNRAKGILMKKMDISENDAYHLIRRQATKERKTLKEIAEAIITASQIDS
ncbi:GAF domain-containing protein [Candidatus Gottesmanbacteria bacterium]|nr:GAF domain-containing protein [Candidatus Gottesmanbacteria bacterium]